MIVITARTKSEFQEALGPARGAILIAWLLDGFYDLDGAILTRAELDQRAAGCERLIIAEDWQEWTKPEPTPKMCQIKNGAFFFGSWLYPPGGKDDNGN